MDLAALLLGRGGRCGVASRAVGHGGARDGAKLDKEVL
jgi:hypothetical protein